MKDRSNDFFLYLFVWFVVSGAVLYLIAAVAGIAAILGALYGGSCALKNYLSSFKEHVIDGNRRARIRP